jgi:hypothetical protein
MRVKFKYIVIAGVALAVVQTGLNLSQRRSPFRFNPFSDAAPVAVRARESSSPSPTTIAVVPVTNWSTQVGAVMKTETSPTGKAITLLGMFPNLPPQGQLEAAQHTSRLLADDYYAALGAQLTNNAITPAARRVLFADLMSRRNTVKLPWLVAVASAEVEGESAEALTLLKATLREDHGTDWVAWRERTTVWLTLHPE